MSSFSRRLICLAPLALAACGFSPVYAPGGTGAVLQDAVQISAPEDRNSFLLVQRLEERLGRSSNPQYSLSLTLQTRQEGIGIDADGSKERFNLIGVAGYVLTDATGANIASGTVNSFTGYSATGNTAVTFAAGTDARERLMIILADQITTRLLAATLPQ